MKYNLIVTLYNNKEYLAVENIDLKDAEKLFKRHCGLYISPPLSYRIEIVEDNQNEND